MRGLREADVGPEVHVFGICTLAQSLNIVVEGSWFRRFCHHWDLTENEETLACLQQSELLIAAVEYLIAITKKLGANLLHEIARLHAGG